jgi:hypothetical protein
VPRPRLRRDENRTKLKPSVPRALYKSVRAQKNNNHVNHLSGRKTRLHSSKIDRMPKM